MPQINGGLIPRNLVSRRVNGLRDYSIPSEVKVFSAATGELLRIEQPTDFETLCALKMKKKGMNKEGI